MPLVASLSRPPSLINDLVFVSKLAAASMKIYYMTMLVVNILGCHSNHGNHDY